MTNTDRVLLHGSAYKGPIPRLPEYSPSPRKVLGFAKYAVYANFFRRESSILTRAKRVTNRNNVVTEKRGGEGIFRGKVYLEPIPQGYFTLVLKVKIALQRLVVKWHFRRNPRTYSPFWLNFGNDQNMHNRPTG